MRRRCGIRGTALCMALPIDIDWVDHSRTSLKTTMLRLLESQRLDRVIVPGHLSVIAVVLSRGRLMG